MIEKNHFPIEFDVGCRECTFDIDSETLSAKEKFVFDLFEKEFDVPAKCITCQLRIALALNGEFPDLNRPLLKSWGWVELKDSEGVKV